MIHNMHHFGSPIQMHALPSTCNVQSPLTVAVAKLPDPRFKVNAQPYSCHTLQGTMELVLPKDMRNFVQHDIFPKLPSASTQPEHEIDSITYCVNRDYRFPRQ